MMTTRSRCLNWETMWWRSIPENSNTATVKKNQNHGSRSRCQPHGKFQPPREGKIFLSIARGKIVQHLGLDPFTMAELYLWCVQLLGSGHDMSIDSLTSLSQTREANCL